MRDVDDGIVGCLITYEVTPYLIPSSEGPEGALDNLDLPVSKPLDRRRYSLGDS